MDHAPFEADGDVFDDERVAITDYVPERSEQIKEWLSTLTPDWKAVDALELLHSNRNSALALGLCIRSGLVQRQRLIDVYSDQMACVVVEATETGDCSEKQVLAFAARLWALANTTSPHPEWRVKLTAEGCQAANDIASGARNAISYACNFATFKKADPDLRMRIVGTPDKDRDSGAFAAAQAVATVVIHQHASVRHESSSVDGLPQEGAESSGGHHRPRITKEAAAVLKFLASRSPMVATLDDIEADTGLARATASEACRSLIEAGYADRPCGPNKGISTTEAGDLVAAKLRTN